MLVDITLKVTSELRKTASKNLDLALVGHIGTHFDVMDKEFPLEYTRRKGIVFDISEISDRGILISDIDLNMISKDMFVLFYLGFIESEGYGTVNYFTKHPQLSDELIRSEISLTGVDFAGIRNGVEYTPKDQYCADRGVFVIENLCNLEKLLHIDEFTVNTYPMNFSDVTGLPCRVIAEVVKNEAIL